MRLKQIPIWTPLIGELSSDDIPGVYGIPYLSVWDCKMFIYEYQTVYNCIVAGDIAMALTLLEQYDDEARYSHRRHIGSIAKFLLSQLIRRAVGGPGSDSGGRHSDRVVDMAIDNAVHQIIRANENDEEKWDPIAGRMRWQKSGYYFNDDELKELLVDEWYGGMIWASLAVLDGERSDAEIEALVSKQDILDEALQLIKDERERMENGN